MKLLKTEKILSSLLVFFVLGIQNVSAADAATLAKAKESGKLFHRLTEEDKTLTLIPDSSFAEDTKKFAFGEMTDKTGFAAECLYYVSKADLVAKSKKEDKASIDTSISAVSKIVRSISKMKGMQYYSNTRKRYETLYTESYRIESPNSVQPVADSLEGSSDGKTMYLYQKEHTFGKAYFQVQYHENKNEVAMHLKNTSPMYYGIVKAVDPDRCRIVANIVDDGDGYYIYLGMSVDFMQLGSILDKKMNKSFQARLDALYNWITLQF